MENLVKEECVTEESKEMINCGFCFHVSKSIKEYRKHKNIMHKDQLKVFSCDLCRFTTPFGETMKLHMKFHNSPPEYISVVCVHCDYLYKYDPQDPKGPRKGSQLLNCHMNKEHENLKMKCDQCSKSFWTENLFRVHLTKHMSSIVKEENSTEENKEMYRCSYCFDAFKSRREYRKHKKNIHKDQLKVFNCDLCRYTTHYAETMKLHRNFHNSPDEYLSVVCVHCDYLYKYDPQDPRGSRKGNQLLNSHMNEEHEDMKLKCDQCDKTFWTDKLLRVHRLKHMRFQDGTYGCDYCEYKTEFSSRLNAHIESVHLGVKRHLCEVCSMGFYTRKGLLTHYMTHTGEKKFKCIICEKSFQTKQYLETHIRIHTGEKPFTCDTCGKSFNDQAYFTKHKRSHISDNSDSNRKTFVCDMCSKSFTRGTHLRNHQRLCSPDSDGKVKKYTNEFKISAVHRAKVNII